MTFLAPWAGIVGAMIAFPLLVAVYLLKLRRKPLRVSSTLLWEQAVQDLQANVPLRWLRPSWLLALQLLALACLLAALARPAVPGLGGVAARTIIVLDHSASMSARDGLAPAGTNDPPSTRLDQAKRAALELVEQVRRASGRRAEVMVASVAAEARVELGFTSDLRSVRDAIESIGPTDQPGRLDDLVRLISAATLGGPDPESRDARTSLVLLSDGAFDAARERLPGLVDLRLVRCGPDQSDPKRMGADNLGIVAIGVRRDAENPSIARIFVRVVNAGATPAEVTLTCRVDGQSVGLLPVTIPAGTRAADGMWTLGEAAGTFEIDRPQGGLAVVSIPRPDLLDCDNTAGVLIQPASKPRILVVGPNDPADPYAAARGPLGIDRFLLGLLQDLDPANLRTMDAASYAATMRDAASANAYDLIIFDRVTPREMPPVPTMSIGAAAPIPGLTVLPAADNAAATRFIAWKRTHPILKNAALDAVLVAPPMRLSIEEALSGPRPQDSAALQSRPTMTPLAFGAAGPLIALVQEPGVRATRRLVLAFDLVRTNWGQDVSFPVFFASAIEHLTGRGEAAAGRSYTTAAPIVLQAPPGVRTLRISGPETRQIDLSPAAPGTPAEVSLGLLASCGVYAFEPAAPSFDRIAVNLCDATESALRTSSSLPIAGREFHAGDTSGTGEPPKREVWPSFIMAAAALLTIEWFVFAWRSRS